MHERGPSLVRFSLFCLVAAALLASLGTPGQAGSLESPEIADPANDQEALGTVPISQQPPEGTTSVGLNSDILFAWVEEISATTLQFTIDVQGTAAPTTSSVTTWTFNFNVSGTTYQATAIQEAASPAGSGATTPGGVTTTATAGGGIIVMTVEKSAIGNPAGGAVLTNLFTTASAALLGEVADFTSDRAPSAGFGNNFTLPGGAGNATVLGDSDGDGLNDTCEMTYFGGLNSTANATADPDGDGLTNGQECALGTDPTKADSDGDGVNDKQDSAPTDPAAGGNTTTSSSSTSSSSTTTSSSSTSSSRPTTSSSSSSSAAQGNDKVDSFDEAVDRLTSDAGYLGMSAGGFLVVLVLAILALAVRWSL